MHLSDLSRTSVFRNTVFLFALLGIVASGVFAATSVRATAFLVDRVDKWLTYQRDQLSTLDEASLRRFVDWNSRYDAHHRWEIILYDPAGRRIAGGELSKPAEMPSDGRPFRFHAQSGEQNVTFRGVDLALPNGESLLISERLSWVALFDRSLLQSALIAGLIVAAVGLASAAVVGVSSLRQIGIMSLSMQAIMRGELSRRLPRGRGLRELDQMAAIVNEMLEQIERLMREVESVTDGIAHDLRTPLTRLLAGLERTRRRAQTTTEYAEGLDAAVVEVQRLLDIFKAMLRLTELETAQRQAGFQQISLRSVAENVVDFMEPVAEQKAIALTLAGVDVSLDADPRLMFEALSNLVDNAIKFTPKGGKVVVNVVDDGAAGFIVTDNGFGIPLHERSAVIQRFYRLETSRSEPGNGLGLSMVNAIGALHSMVLCIGDAGPGTRVSLRRAATTLFGA